MARNQKNKKSKEDIGLISSSKPTNQPKKRSFWKIIIGLIALLVLLAIAVKFGSVEYLTNVVKNNPIEETEVENISVAEDSQIGVATKILGIKLNEKVGDKGIVEVDGNSFPSSASEINASVFIDGAKSGTKIAVVLQQKGSDSRIGPIIKDISLEGTVAYNFAFQQPLGGWPVGDYSVQAEITTGETGEVEFSITK
ncbi:MAG TPA: hypothetical protein P5096_03335 [Patescibacteria group bacterium]|nr:hypothetical protein [Patescibacteria group bacterium]